MKSHVEVAVIGGGLIGCSILYHLARLGCTDVMLLERSELTSGSTWHAAAGIHGLHDNNNVSRMQYYTMNLYRELERETGQSCGIHQPGAIYLACTEERVHQLRIQASKAPAFDAEFYELSLPEVRDLHPLLDLDGVRIAMFEPMGGHVDPSGVTHAYAQGARKAGAEIHRFTPVEDTVAKSDGSWTMITPKGNVHAQIVVNAAGLWGREVAAMAGISLPLMPLEHQYFVTEGIPQIRELGRELPAVADRDHEYYMRQEGQGLLVGVYEKDGRFWAENGTPMDFGHDLLQEDLDRISDNVMRACDRVPALAEAGVKTVINGPMIWSPDTSAVVGPVRGLKNYFVCTGIIPGFSQSAGLGKTVAEWIVEGEPELDLFAWDVARFGSWATRSYAKARALDNYSSRFRIHFPNEEREAGRPVRTRPVHALQKSLGGVFGLSYGWEHAQWYARGVPAKDDFSFRRPAWFDTVGEEVAAVRNAAGLIDVSNFAKYRITGPGAASWLDRIVANRVPRLDGRMCLTPLLSLRGGVAGDFTVARLAEGHFFMIGSGIAEDYHRRIFERYLPSEGVEFECVTDRLCGVNVAGPKAREIMEKLTGGSWSSETLPFMRNATLKIRGHDALVIRVSFSGDLGYEIYVDESCFLDLYTALLSTGEGFGIRPVGSRALGSMRIEKGYGSWGREYSPEWHPHESGLQGLIRVDKPEFAGREAWVQLMDTTPRQLLCQFELEPASGEEDADAWGGESITLDGDYVGRVTSGAYSYTHGKSVALGYLDGAAVHPGGRYGIAVLGRPRPAILRAEPLFDPRGDRLRS